MANLIVERVEAARRGRNQYVICRMKSGWLAIGDVQPLSGYCVLLADPVQDGPFIERMRAYLNSGSPA